VRTALRSQLHAALDMLEAAVRACPMRHWTDPSYHNAFWHIAYHALFYTHLYVQRDEASFVPWPNHRGESQFLGPLPWPPHRPPRVGAPYSREEILEYAALVHIEVETRLLEADLDAAESGFAWLPFGKLELLLYTLRHVQHHAGQLIDRVRNDAGVGVEWVGMTSV